MLVMEKLASFSFLRFFYGYYYFVHWKFYICMCHILIIFILIFVYVFMLFFFFFLLERLWYVHRRRSIRPNLWELILQVVVSYLMWVQQTKCRLSGRAPGALNHLSNEVLSKYFVTEKLHFKLPLLWVERVF